MSTLIILTEDAYHLRQFRTEKEMKGALEAVVETGKDQGLVFAAGYSKTGALVYTWPEEG
ncbi:MAG: hypothetical protein V4563_17325 [Pseudomonadota bacterium]